MGKGSGKARWYHHLTGGRPMKDMGFAFRDIVSGESVRNYQDAFGHDWLATGPWASFRIEGRCASFAECFPTASRPRKAKRK